MFPRGNKIPVGFQFDLGHGFDAFGGRRHAHPVAGIPPGAVMLEGGLRAHVATESGNDFRVFVGHLGVGDELVPEGIEGDTRLRQVGIGAEQARGLSNLREFIAQRVDHPLHVGVGVCGTETQRGFDLAAFFRKEFVDEHFPELSVGPAVRVL